ncbi:hypothetical protein M3625_06985 [Paenibacillus sp. MER 78]|nr:hypothetical protein [Paenibacillus sp. MER 78]
MKRLIESGRFDPSSMQMTFAITDDEKTIIRLIFGVDIIFWKSYLAAIEQVGRKQMLNQRRLTSKSYHMQRIIAWRRRESLDERLRQDYSFVVIQFHPLITYVLLAPFALLVK